MSLDRRTIVVLGQPRTSVSLESFPIRDSIAALVARRFGGGTDLPIAALVGSMFAALLLAAVPASAGTRVALVVGNSAYQNVPFLPNPVNDAADLSASLRRLGFDIKTMSNARYDDIRRALSDFGQQARGAELAVIFFAGHGFQIGGENWLIPVDARLAIDLDVVNETIGLQSLMRAVSHTTKLGLVILDASRNDPFRAKMQSTNLARAVERGFSRVEPSDNVLVAYAARDGTTANDGSGRNSPFTSSLLKNIEIPGLEVRFLFANVRDDVMAATGREQQPVVYGPLSRDMIYLTHLKDANSADLQTSRAVPAALPPKPPAAVADRCSQPGANNCGSIGVRLQRVSEDVAEALKIKPPRGALIADIDQNGPAKPAGIQPGDVVVGFDGKDINDVLDLPRAIVGTTVGKEVDVVIIRDAKEQLKKIIVARRVDVTSSVDGQPKGPSTVNTEAQTRFEELRKKDQVTAVAPPANHSGPPLERGRETEVKMISRSPLQGAMVSNTSPALVGEFQLDSSAEGVVVTQVPEGTTAANVGFRKGDLILKVNDKKIAKTNDLESATRESSRVWRMEIRRDGQPISVTLGG